MLAEVNDKKVLGQPLVNSARQTSYPSAKKTSAEWQWMKNINNIEETQFPP